MSRVLLWAMALLLPTTLVNSCGPPGPTPVTYTAYRLSCCTKEDVERLWQPGTTVELHWIVLTVTATTTDNTTHKVVTSATMLGPYSDGTTSKPATDALRTIHGSPITMDDRKPPAKAMVTTFLLPPDLPRGFYKLDIRSAFGDGGSGLSEGHVRVGTQ